jgi:hypothetical protein
MVKAKITKNEEKNPLSNPHFSRKIFTRYNGGTADANSEHTS